MIFRSGEIVGLRGTSFGSVGKFLRTKPSSLSFGFAEVVMGCVESACVDLDRPSPAELTVIVGMLANEDALLLISESSRSLELRSLDFDGTMLSKNFLTRPRFFLPGASFTGGDGGRGIVGDIERTVGGDI